MKAFCLLTILLVACDTGMPSGPTTKPQVIPRGKEPSRIPEPTPEPVPPSPPAPAPKTSATDATGSQFPTGTVSAPPPLSAPPMTTAEITHRQTAQVDNALAQLQSFGESRAYSLPDSQVPVFGPSVTKSDAVATISSLQAEILKTFSGPQYAGLREALTQAVAGQGWTARLPVQQAPPPFGGIQVVRRNDLVDVIHELLALARGVTTRPENRVSISVHTEPQNATFILCPQYLTDGCYSITTPGDLPDLFRGLYTYTITLAGYKTTKFNLDLVHFSQKQLKCTLHPTTAVDLVSPCTPQ